MEKCNFEKLEMLNLKGNQIEDKSIIEKLKTKIKVVMIWLCDNDNNWIVIYMNY